MRGRSRAVNTVRALAGSLALLLLPVPGLPGQEEKPPGSAATGRAGEPGFSTPQDDEPTPSMRDEADWGAGDPGLAPIAADAVDRYSLGIYTDVGYRNDQGRYVIDLLEQDYAYLTLIVTDLEGRPVVGAVPEFEIQGTSQLLLPDEVGSRSATDASGTLDFAVVGGVMALDRVTISVGDALAELLVNVISLRASGFPTPPAIEGSLAWSELMGARIRYLEDAVAVEFPATVRARADQQVILSGFMMPLDPDLVQRRFLLTSNPPSCFYHIPGGPAGAVEVFAPEGIEASWDPIVVEGRFETLNTNDYGVIYRLHDAELQKP